MALIIDHSTSAVISDINHEIGTSAHRVGKFGALQRWKLKLSDRERLKREREEIGKDYSTEPEYRQLLQEYVDAKLLLHSLRKSMYYPYDAYAEREGDFTPVLARCKELSRQIREMRGQKIVMAWGDTPPAQKPTVYDKPLLYAMDDHTCSYVDDWSAEESIACPVAGEHWFKGLPYCRKHFGTIRTEAKTERRWKQAQAKARHRASQLSGDWSLQREERCSEKRCDKPMPHIHASGRVYYDVKASGEYEVPKQEQLAALLPKDERPMLPHGKANGRRGSYFA